MSTIEKAAQQQAQALRAEGALHLKAMEVLEKGSDAYSYHASRVVELAPMVALLDVHSRPPSGGRG